MGEIAQMAGINARDGIIPAQGVRALIDAGVVKLAAPLKEKQLQPASLDLRLGATAYRVRASFLPGPDATVRSRIDALALHQIDLTAGAVLETGCVYIVPPARDAGIAGGNRGRHQPEEFNRAPRCIYARHRRRRQCLRSYPRRLQRCTICRDLPADVSDHCSPGLDTEPDPLSHRPSRRER